MNIDKDNNKIITENLNKKQNDKYHHGDLRESLIQMGLKLLAEEGPQNFSLRKLASMCNVSHAAPYKHFKNKDEIIKAIGDYIAEKFKNTLLEVVHKYKDNPSRQTIELGKSYVYFMVENNDYLKLLFLNNSNYNISVDIQSIGECNYEPFNIFKNSAIDLFEFLKIKEEDYSRNIIAMWSVVHGLAIMLSNNTIKYEGDYLELVENILVNNITF